MLEFLGLVALCFCAFLLGMIVMGTAWRNNIRRRVAAGLLVVDDVQYSVSPAEGDQSSNAVLRFKEAIATGMLDGEIGRAVMRNQQRVGQ